jgi:hypothetical protein
MLLNMQRNSEHRIKFFGLFLKPYRVSFFVGLAGPAEGNFHAVAPKDIDGHIHCQKGEELHSRLLELVNDKSWSLG